MMQDILFHPVVLPFVKILILFGAMQGVVAYLTLAERKVSAWMQDRLGPNRVGPFGVLQPLADGIKFFFKEDITPPYVHKFFFIAAPMMVLVAAFTSFTVIPFGSESFEVMGHEVTPWITDVNVGLLFILAVSSMGVYGIILAGYSSNNKYSLFGGMRAAAQMISYELPMGLAAAGVFLAAGSYSLRDIVAVQTWSGHYWNILPQFLGFIAFVVAAFAETNRLPFDLPEAETELVGGYHTEYSSMKFAMFFMGEYANMVMASFLIVLLYLGGWHVPFIDVENPFLQIMVFASKVGVMLFIFLWVRWTLPRFRYDQLMRLGWKVLLPMAMLNFVLVAFFILMGWM